MKLYSFKINALNGLIYISMSIFLCNTLSATNVVNINKDNNNNNIENEADIKNQLHAYKSISKWIVDNKDNFSQVLNETAKKTTTKWVVEYNKEHNTESEKSEESIKQNMFHIVKEKETLFSISKKYNLKLEDLIRFNNLNKNKSIYIGQKLLLKEDNKKDDIQYSMDSPLDNNLESDDLNNPSLVYPKYKYYQVQNGDTIYSISKSVNMKPDELLKFNNLSKLSLYPGMILKIYANYEKNIINHSNNKENNKFEWPLIGRLLISFGPQKSGIVSEGINIMAKKGSPIKAVSDGVVVYVGNGVKSLGNIILIQHNQGWISVYGYVENPLIKKGDEVKQGEVIAKVGKPDNVKIPQLHFELRQNIVAKDPLEYLNSYT